MWDNSTGGYINYKRAMQQFSDIPSSYILSLFNMRNLEEEVGGLKLYM